ncbi:ribulose 1,5-bisphosphate carboxylase large subunit [Rhodococcus sp. NPDC049939]|uniref:ribulose 1,5-bisphosphate carboxylase large subunit n=1 Tax=Rhodococcus sp. NPDC049939 TaxID=3155511 RepID=UPI0033F22801
MPPVHSPRPLVRSATGLALLSVNTAGLVVSLPRRIIGLLYQVEALIAHIEILVNRIEVLVNRIETISGGAETTVAKASTVTNDAAAVVAVAADASASVQNLVGLYEPLAEKAAPVAQRVVDEFSEEEIRAAIGLVNHLPELTLRMEGLLPILGTLDTVSPEIHQLLEEVQGVRQAILGVPGFKYFRKRGETRYDG